MSEISIGIRRRDGETWRECAARIGRHWHLEAEVLEEFDAFIAAGDDEAEAAWCACYEWDVCEPSPAAPAPEQQAPFARE